MPKITGDNFLKIGCHGNVIALLGKYFPVMDA